MEGFDRDTVEVLYKATAVYFIGVLLLRISKKRLLRGMSALDILVTVILGSLLSRGITGGADIVSTAVASITLVFCHWLLSFLTYHSQACGWVLKGEPRVIIKEGKLDESAACKEFITNNDLEIALRRAGLKNIDDVEEARIERNGSITFIKREQS